MWYELSAYKMSVVRVVHNPCKHVMTVGTALWDGKREKTQRQAGKMTLLFFSYTDVTHLM